FSSALGGRGSDDALAVAVDAQGGTWLGGSTSSIDFPTRAAWRSTPAGMQDGYLMHLDAAGTPLSSTYLGGGDDDKISAIAIDGAGTVYVAGYSYSVDLPLAGPLSINHGLGDAWVARLDATATTILYSA